MPHALMKCLLLMLASVAACKAYDLVYDAGNAFFLRIVKTKLDANGAMDTCLAKHQDASRSSQSFSLVIDCIIEKDPKVWNDFVSGVSYFPADELKAYLNNGLQDIYFSGCRLKDQVVKDQCGAIPTHSSDAATLCKFTNCFRNAVMSSAEPSCSRGSLSYYAVSNIYVQKYCGASGK